LAPRADGRRHAAVAVRLLRRLAALLTWVEGRPVALSCLALAVAAGVSAAMAFAVADPHAVREAGLDDFTAPWLGLLVAAQAVSYASYTVAHRWAMMVRGRGEVTSGTALRMAAYGAAATSLRGGFSLDRRALRGAGASRRHANVRVLALGALEYAVLAPAAWACAVALLGDTHVQKAVTIPWALGVPLGSIAAMWVTSAVRPHPRRTGLLRRALDDALGALEVLGELLRHPLRRHIPWLAMSVHWAAEVLSLWAALRAFGLDPSLDVIVLGYATGYALTPRSMPLAGAGVTEVLLPLALLWVGLPLAHAVVSVFAYRIVRLLLAMPAAIAARERVQELIRRHRHASQSV